jgi:hypothetical protein
MEAAHIHVVRVGEFAWSRLEPREGEFDVDWLDRAVAPAAKHGIWVVVGTSGAAPPAWLTRKYPDTLHRAGRAQGQAWQSRTARSMRSSGIRPRNTGARPTPTGARYPQVRAAIRDSTWSSSSS